MKRVVIALMVMSVMFMTGCQSMSDGKLSYNMTQSLSRSGGDVAMTALLDEGVDAKKSREYVAALTELIEKGELSKIALRQACLDLAVKLKITGAANYIDALMIVIPSRIAEYQEIPKDIRIALVSFLRDGATRALDLYKTDKKPALTSP